MGRQSRRFKQTLCGLQVNLRRVNDRRTDESKPDSAVLSPSRFEGGNFNWFLLLPHAPWFGKATLHFAKQDTPLSQGGIFDSECKNLWLHPHLVSAKAPGRSMGPS